MCLGKPKSKAELLPGLALDAHEPLKPLCFKPFPALAQKLKSAFTLSASEVRVFRPLISFLKKLFSDILHQNLIASNKCVNVVRKCVGRMGTLSWSIFCLSVAGSDRQGDKLGTGSFSVCDCKSSGEGGGQTEQCPPLSSLHWGGSSFSPPQARGG